MIRFNDVEPSCVIITFLPFTKKTKLEVSVLMIATYLR